MIRVAIIASLVLFACLVGLPLKSARAQNLRLTDLGYGPKKIQIQWDPPPGSCPAEPGYPENPGMAQTGPSWTNWTALNRTPGSSTGNAVQFPIALPSSNSFDDADWNVNIRYEYYLTGATCTYTWYPPVETEEEYIPGYWVVSSVPWQSSSIYVTVRKVTASSAGAVDTRLDLRYGNPTLQDYKFHESVYRGGLFAGFNQDNSKVGRTYLKFSVSGPVQSGEHLWPVAGLCVYSTRLAKSGSASLVCRRATSNSWSASSLIWSNAPTLESSGGGSLNLSWSDTSPAGQWATMAITPDIEYALANGGVLTSVIRAASEGGIGTGTTANTSDGWAYFAKAAYTAEGADKEPFLLYAFGGPGASVDSISVSPNQITMGDTGTGTVTLNFNAPPGGMIVSLSCNNSHVSVPATVTIPEGSNSATFTVTTNSISLTGTTITATLGGTRSVVVVVLYAS